MGKTSSVPTTEHHTGIEVHIMKGGKGNLFSLGSMVQNGKFSAGAEAFVNTLKNVDFLQSKYQQRVIEPAMIPHPTLGRPTIPHLREVPKRPRRGPGPSTSFFLGGILRFPSCKHGERKRKVLFNAHSLSNANLLAVVPRKDTSIYTNSICSSCFRPFFR